MPPTIDQDDSVTVPLNQFVREIAREAAQVVIDNHIAGVIDNHIATCRAVYDVKRLKLCVDGNPENQEAAPGLKIRVAGLEQSRNFVRKSLWGVWLFIVAIGGGLAGMFWK